MKKVVLGLLILGQLGMAKENWYVILMAKKVPFNEQCNLYNDASPDNARNSGYEVNLENGYYSVRGADIIPYAVFNNKKQCLKALEKIKPYLQ